MQGISTLLTIISHSFVAIDYILFCSLNLCYIFVVHSPFFYFVEFPENFLCFLLCDIPSPFSQICLSSKSQLLCVRTYEKQFIDCKLLPAQVRIRIYSEKPLSILGKLKVTVNLKYTYYIYVIHRNGQSLLGRNWLAVLKLHWTSTFKRQECDKNSSKEKGKFE